MAIAARTSTGTSNVATTAATTLSCSTPAGTADGDVLIAALGIGNASPGTSPTVTATGWTALTLGHDAGDSSGGVDCQLFWKVWHTGDATSYSFGLSASRLYSVAMMAYSGVDNTTPIHVEDATFEAAATQTTHTTPSVTTTDAGAWIVTAFTSRNSGVTWTPPSGMTERVDQANSGTSPAGGVELNDSAGTVTPGSYSYTATCSASSSVAGMSIAALLPATSGGGGGGSGAVTYESVATAASAGAATTSVVQSVPAGVSNGDLLIWSMSVQVASTVTIPGTPSGWQSWATATPVGTSSQTGAVMWYRIASSEPASYSLTITSQRYSSHMMAFSGADTTTPKDVATVIVTNTSAQAAPGAITPVTAGAVVLATDTQAAASGVTNTTFSSSNGVAVVGTASSASSSTLNTASASTYMAAWSSGAVTPNLVASGTPARGIAFTSAIRPAPGATVTPRPISLIRRVADFRGVY